MPLRLAYPSTILVVIGGPFLLPGASQEVKTAGPGSEPHVIFAVVKTLGAEGAQPVARALLSMQWRSWNAGATCLRRPQPATAGAQLLRRRNSKRNTLPREKSTPSTSGATTPERSQCLSRNPSVALPCRRWSAAPVPWKTTTSGRWRPPYPSRPARRPHPAGLLPRKKLRPCSSPAPSFVCMARAPVPYVESGSSA